MSVVHVSLGQQLEQARASRDEVVANRAKRRPSEVEFFTARAEAVCRTLEWLIANEQIIAERGCGEADERKRPEGVR